MKRLLMLLSICLGVIALAGCKSKDFAPDGSEGYPAVVDEDDPNSGEGYLDITENPFTAAAEDNTSTFSMDVSTAGYTNIRRMIESGYGVDEFNADSVKIEEMVNYFEYAYDAPAEGDMAVYSEMMDCPWNTEHKLATIAVKAKAFEHTDDVQNNLVFLLDVSGSMADANKLPLLKEGMTLFAANLKDSDIISIVTYCGTAGVKLDGAMGSEKNRIISVIDDLTAGGSTAGASGIQIAYDLAQDHFIQGGNNRIILGTDGDFNVGISNLDELKTFISEKRTTGIYMSLLGFGTGNLQDDTMETLAQNGNGTYSYIDSINEARRVLVEDISGTLFVVAKDVKAQVVFNPEFIEEYRLIGYENKKLTDDEFEDVTKDAGEVGSGHVTTAVYELVLKPEQEIQALDPNWYTTTIRYKDPSTDVAKEISKAFDGISELTAPSEDIRFVSAVVELGLILRKSEYKGTASLDSIVNRIQNLSCLDQDEYKAEFLELIQRLKQN